MKLIRITTVPMSLKYLLEGQMKYMTDNGLEVLMVSSAGDEVESLVKLEKCRFIEIPMSRAITPFQDLKSLWLMIRLFRKERPDIVHTHTPKAGLIGMLAAKLTRVPVKMHTIAGLPLMTTTGFKRNLLIFIEKVTYWAADTVLPNSKSIRSYIEKNKLTKKSKLHIIGDGSSNGIDLNHFSKEYVDDDSLRAVKQLIKYKAESFYVLSVGRVVKDKGINELVNAFVRINRKNSSIKLILVGKFEQERKTENLTKDVLKLIRTHKDIVHINWSDAIREYMYLADLLVHASHREGFPNVVLQAGAMELPIICSEIPGNIDIVRDQETGLYFKVGNQDDLTVVLQKAIDDDYMLKERARLLRNEIEKKFNRGFIWKSLLSYYEKRLKILNCSENKN